jgi:hypothetical protein
MCKPKPPKITLDDDQIFLKTILGHGRLLLRVVITSEARLGEKVDERSIFKAVEPRLLHHLQLRPSSTNLLHPGLRRACHARRKPRAKVGAEKALIEGAIADTLGSLQANSALKASQSKRGCRTG